jgi:hypothetical protein
MIYAPTLVTACTALPPKGGAFFLGAARRKNISLFELNICNSLN